jgi:hypothetical protein
MDLEKLASSIFLFTLFLSTDFADYPGTISRSYGAGTDYSNYYEG